MILLVSKLKTKESDLDLPKLPVTVNDKNEREGINFKWDTESSLKFEEVLSKEPCNKRLRTYNFLRKKHRKYEITSEPTHILRTKYKRTKYKKDSKRSTVRKYVTDI